MFWNFGKKKALRKKEKELLYQLQNKRLSTNQMLGKYKLPKILHQLSESSIAEKVVTLPLGFQFHLSSPVTPEGIDLIPFAMTGGDSCHFSFITDFGLQKNLENAPIAFISPTDFDSHKPYQSNFLIASNIREFLSLMCTLKYAEHIRFQDIYAPEINGILRGCIKQFDNESDEDYLKSEAAIQLLRESFGIDPIKDFYQHFQDVKTKRFKTAIIPTTDGLNITPPTLREPIEVIASDAAQFISTITSLNKISKWKAIRDAPYQFKSYSNEYLPIKKAILSELKTENMDREYTILKHEMEYYETSKKYFDLRSELRK